MEDLTPLTWYEPDTMMISHLEMMNEQAGHTPGVSDYYWLENQRPDGWQNPGQLDSAYLTASRGTCSGDTVSSGREDSINQRLDDFRAQWQNNAPGHIDSEGYETTFPDTNPEIYGSGIGTQPTSPASEINPASTSRSRRSASHSSKGQTEGTRSSASRVKKPGRVYDTSEPVELPQTQKNNISAVEKLESIPVQERSPYQRAEIRKYKKRINRARSRGRQTKYVEELEKSLEEEILEKREILPSKTMSMSSRLIESPKTGRCEIHSDNQTGQEEYKTFEQSTQESFPESLGSRTRLPDNTTSEGSTNARLLETAPRKLENREHVYRHGDTPSNEWIRQLALRSEASRRAEKDQVFIDQKLLYEIEKRKARERYSQVAVDRLSNSDYLAGAWSEGVYRQYWQDIKDIEQEEQIQGSPNSAGYLDRGLEPKYQ
ncbi:uncharacterized protein I206_106474 [Kwoniella pini CBS 10737]|uniref:Uncharacterized protein n=1 Tax=Kwoniella pini CBS 10737 TaxID=1296096 RepID=A0A1B9HUE8_9TREE|nr:uncharacterized protein I206_07279 [Kwoniella pini CBS 10737]OCF46892.1 hypothetical protein I206_07279 [Kwoniella pini CBS 10737]